MNVEVGEKTKLVSNRFVYPDSRGVSHRGNGHGKDLGSSNEMRQYTGVSATNSYSIYSDDEKRELSGSIVISMQSDYAKKNVDTQSYGKSLDRYVHLIEKTDEGLGGVLDPRMGPTEKGVECPTCRQQVQHCPGHYGRIELAVPVFLYDSSRGPLRNALMRALKGVCLWCCKMYPNKEEKKKNHQVMKQYDIDCASRKEAEEGDDEEEGECGVECGMLIGCVCDHTITCVELVMTNVSHTSQTKSKSISSPAAVKIRHDVKGTDSKPATTEFDSLHVWSVFKELEADKDTTAENIKMHLGVAIPSSLCPRVLLVLPPVHRPDKSTVDMMNDSSKLGEVSQRYKTLILKNNRMWKLGLANDYKQIDSIDTSDNEREKVYKQLYPTNPNDDTMTKKLRLEFIVEQFKKYSNQSIGIAAQTKKRSRKDSDRNRNQNNEDEAIKDALNTLVRSVNDLINGYQIKGEGSGGVEQDSAGRKDFAGGLWGILDGRGEGGGKHSIFRQALIGKRTGYVARTVILGDPTVPHDSVAIPRLFAEKLTVEMPVLRPLSSGKPNVAFANIMSEARQPSRTLGRVVSVRLANPKRGERTEWIFAELDATERDQLLQLLNRFEKGRQPMQLLARRLICEGDVVMVNRQPTLQRQNLQGLRVIIIEGDCIKINPEQAGGYAADFDGDAMNLFVPQNMMAMIELRLLHNPSLLVATANGVVILKPGPTTILGMHALTGILETNMGESVDFLEQVAGTLRTEDLTTLASSQLDKGPWLQSTLKPDWLTKAKKNVNTHESANMQLAQCAVELLSVCMPIGFTMEIGWTTFKCRDVNQLADKYWIQLSLLKNTKFKSLVLYCNKDGDVIGGMLTPVVSALDLNVIYEVDSANEHEFDHVGSKFYDGKCTNKIHKLDRVKLSKASIFMKHKLNPNHATDVRKFLCVFSKLPNLLVKNPDGDDPEYWIVNASQPLLYQLRQRKLEGKPFEPEQFRDYKASQWKYLPSIVDKIASHTTTSIFEYIGNSPHASLLENGIILNMPEVTYLAICAQEDGGRPIAVVIEPGLKKAEEKAMEKILKKLKIQKVSEMPNITTPVLWSYRHFATVPVTPPSPISLRVYNGRVLKPVPHLTKHMLEELNNHILHYGGGASVLASMGCQQKIGHAVMARLNVCASAPYDLCDVAVGGKSMQTIMESTAKRPCYDKGDTSSPDLVWYELDNPMSPLDFKVRILKVYESYSSDEDITIACGIHSINVILSAKRVTRMQIFKKYVKDIAHQIPCTEYKKQDENNAPEAITNIELPRISPIDPYIAHEIKHSIPDAAHSLINGGTLACVTSGAKGKPADLSKMSVCVGLRKVRRASSLVKSTQTLGDCGFVAESWMYGIRDYASYVTSQALGIASELKSKEDVASAGYDTRKAVLACYPVVAGMHGEARLMGQHPRIVQPVYGGDGLDPHRLQKIGQVRTAIDMHAALAIAKNSKNSKSTDANQSSSINVLQDIINRLPGNHQSIFTEVSSLCAQLKLNPAQTSCLQHIVANRLEQSRIEYGAPIGAWAVEAIMADLSQTALDTKHGKNADAEVRYKQLVEFTGNDSVILNMPKLSKGIDRSFQSSLFRDSLKLRNTVYVWTRTEASIFYTPRSADTLNNMTDPMIDGVTNDIIGARGIGTKLQFANSKVAGRFYENCMKRLHKQYDNELQMSAMAYNETVTVVCSYSEPPLHRALRIVSDVALANDVTVTRLKEILKDDRVTKTDRGCIGVHTIATILALPLTQEASLYLKPLLRIEQRRHRMSAAIYQLKRWGAVPADKIKIIADLLLRAVGECDSAVDIPLNEENAKALRGRQIISAMRATMQTNNNVNNDLKQLLNRGLEECISINELVRYRFEAEKARIAKINEQREHGIKKLVPPGRGKVTLLINTLYKSQVTVLQTPRQVTKNPEYNAVSQRTAQIVLGQVDLPHELNLVFIELSLHEPHEVLRDFATGCFFRANVDPLQHLRPDKSDVTRCRETLNRFLSSQLQMFDSGISGLQKLYYKGDNTVDLEFQVSEKTGAPIREEAIADLNAENISNESSKSDKAPMISEDKLTTTSPILNTAEELAKQCEDASKQCKDPKLNINNWEIEQWIEDGEYPDITQKTIDAIIAINVDNPLTAQTAMGLEVGRLVMVTEMEKVFANTNLDPRHIELIADILSTEGSLRGVGYTDVRNKRTPLELSAYENIQSSLTEAAVQDRVCVEDSVHVSAMYNRPPKLGTGLIGVDCVNPPRKRACDDDELMSVIYVNKNGKRKRGDDAPAVVSKKQKT